MSVGSSKDEKHERTFGESSLEGFESHHAICICWCLANTLKRTWLLIICQRHAMLSSYIVQASGLFSDREENMFRDYSGIRTGRAWCFDSISIARKV